MLHLRRSVAYALEAVIPEASRRSVPEGGWMRKIVVAALIVAGIFFAHGPLSSQNAVSPTLSDQDIQLLRKDLRSQKKQIVAANLTLTDAEAQHFWPIYDRYTAELAKINDAKLSLVKEYADNYATLTDPQALSIIQRWSAADESVVQLRIKYIRIIQKVLPGKKTALFFQIDRRLGAVMDLQVASEIPIAEP
jgi:hypothetical protein